MPSVILNIAAKYLKPILFVLSLIVLYRGHNYPGGGFIGGLIAASAVMLSALADGWDKVQHDLRMKPLNLMTIGLAIALISGLIGLMGGYDFFKGLWLPPFELPLIGKVKLGTPFLFDVGVYLGVIGFTVKCAHAIGTED